MANWIMGIVVAIVLTTLIDLVMHEGETKKYVKGIASLLVLAAIIAPLPTIFDTTIQINNPQNDTIQNDSSLNDGYLHRIYTERYKNYELTIQKKLKDAGLDGITIRISFAYNYGTVEITNIIADKSLMVITGGEANIDINKTITATIKSTLSVDESKIIISE